MKEKGTVRVGDRYDRISPYYDLMEWLLERVLFSRWRKKVFDALEGETILEVGVGTGENFDFYPDAKQITGIDFSEGMLRIARKKAEKKGLKEDLEYMDVQDLQFKDQSFDAIVASFVFCSVSDPTRGLEEIKRVCKRGGRVVLLEHVRPGTKLLGRLFDLLNPVTVKLTGANINRDTVSNMKRAGLHIIEERNLFRDFVKLLVAHP